MRRIDQICGLAVVDITSGAKIGDVAQVILCAKSKSVAGIDISSRGFMQKQRFIGFGDIEIFGDVSLLIKNDCFPATNGRHEKPKNCLSIGQRIYLTDGFDIGWLTNAMIDEVSGEVQSLEVSHGYIDDLSGERRWISEFSCGGQGITALSGGRS